MKHLFSCISHPQGLWTPWSCLCNFSEDREQSTMHIFTRLMMIIVRINDSVSSLLQRSWVFFKYLYRLNKCPHYVFPSSSHNKQCGPFERSENQALKSEWAIPLVRFFSLRFIYRPFICTSQTTAFRFLKYINIFREGFFHLYYRYLTQHFSLTFSEKYSKNYPFSFTFLICLFQLALSSQHINVLL